MNIGKIKSVKLSLMQKAGEVNGESKADYTLFISAEFKIPKDFFRGTSLEEKECLLESLVEVMYDDILKKNNEAKTDSLGIWIDYNGKILENAISIDTIRDMKTYGAEDISPVWEFAKMTLK